MKEGQVLRSMVRDDAYRVVRVLAEGPSGRTELVTLDGGELLVRKRIPASLANASAWAVLMGMNEPRLPHIEELYEMPDELVVVYSYVPGRSVAELVAQEGRQRPADAVALVAQACTAAAALHEAGIVHRDITPGNVIVADDGAHLVDLGIARRPRPDGTRDTAVLGTWGFAAPEQFGFAQTDRRSDIYALGRLLGYLLTGVRPDDDAYGRLLADEAVVPARFARVVERSTAFEPSARYQDVVAMKEALADALAGGVAAEGSRERPRPAPGDGTARGGQAPSQVAPDMAPPRKASPLEWAAAILVWAAMAIVVLTDAWTTYDTIVLGDPAWGPAQYGMSASMLCCAAAVAVEAYQAVLRRGAYALARRPLLMALKEVCKIVVIFLILLVLCAAVLPAGGK